MSQDHQTLHIPVLKAEVLRLLDPKKGETLFDATAGYGGHAAAILERTLQGKGSVLVDRDEYAVQALNERFGTSNVLIHRSDFVAAAQMMLEKKQSFDLILADLGISSPHLDNQNRGFSLKQDGPLDMRMDTSQMETAADIVNFADKDTLSGILLRYGEERRANRIAQAIITHRPIDSTAQLARIVADTIGGIWRRTHPATRTFQALRIAVNDELTQVTTALPLWTALLKPGGRIGIISFHSLEDRIVKTYFREHSENQYEAQLRLITKQPIVPSHDELVLNPRARSAKLRVAVKIKTKGRGL